jgi:hypothetical protein
MKSIGSWRNEPDPWPIPPVVGSKAAALGELAAYRPFGEHSIRQPPAVSAHDLLAYRRGISGRKWGPAALKAEMIARPPESGPIARRYGQIADCAGAQSGGPTVWRQPKRQMVASMLSCVTTGFSAPGVIVWLGTSAAITGDTSRAKAAKRAAPIFIEQREQAHGRNATKGQARIERLAMAQL